MGHLPGHFNVSSQKLKFTREEIDLQKCIQSHPGTKPQSQILKPETMLEVVHLLLLQCRGDPQGVQVKPGTIPFHWLYPEESASHEAL